MKSMQWKLAVSCALLALCSLAAYAQSGEPQGPPPGPPDAAAQGGPPPRGERKPDPERQLRMLTRLLTLSNDQQAAIKPILEQESAQMQALRSKSDSETANSGAPESRQARMAQIQQIRDDSNTKIAALLNDSQKKDFADWIAKRAAEMEKRRSQGPAAPPPDGAAPPPGEML